MTDTNKKTEWTLDIYKASYETRTSLHSLFMNLARELNDTRIQDESSTLTF